ncbi:Microtubule-associated serine/threonine-protein kinase 2 [Microtus ochrogaster]|uniref:Microtubule-associated serine/threonine-protein kinase 2 n=1 Tax=Microtus ochrogaster TaxID=79684 RepID=A0A8J6KP35_MICOH|nr:Microtubule-associated serine/threonine-protein kinase 2 [Microtus ochrogaster]
MKRSRCRERPQPPPARREDAAPRATELPQPQPLPPRRRAPPGRQRLEERSGPAGPDGREQDVVTGLSPLLFRKLSNPDIFSPTGKTKLHRQLSQDDCKLRRGSLASSLSGKQLLPLSSSVHSSVGQVTWQSTGEASNLVRMRNQSLGQSAPSLTAGLPCELYLYSCASTLVQRDNPWSRLPLDHDIMAPNVELICEPQKTRKK